MLAQEINVLGRVFEDLQFTSSRTSKEQIVKEFERLYPEYKEDWDYILETLAGAHPIGYTFVPDVTLASLGYGVFHSIKAVIQYLENLPNKTYAVTLDAARDIGTTLGRFIEPIVNRKLRLGIGKSLLSKSDLTPMLAKKYEGQSFSDGFVITEKLDGNRCMAHYDNNLGVWLFTSRSGKPLKVDFDMTGVNTDYIYDGEVMSLEQTKLSIKRHEAILDDKEFKESIDTKQAQLLFNQTSGLINRNGTKKGLIYNVFDVIDRNHIVNYDTRRSRLQAILKEAATPDIRLLPTLYYGKDKEIIDSLLYKIVGMGGEGIMLNDIAAAYEHKRSSALLKYKQVKTMDLLVTNIVGGAGKYEGLVGALICEAYTDDGKHIYVQVGSGLSDQERWDWMRCTDNIIGKIVEVGYHELTQTNSAAGSNEYSLRFPRLLRVRRDKTLSSEY